MRICLLSTTYPPASTEGIARQRQALARELAHRGHEIHVVTCGNSTQEWDDTGVRVHQVATVPINHFLDAYPELNQALTESQALYEGLRAAEQGRPFDIVEAPLWKAQAFVTAQRYRGILIVWLQTTTAQLMQINKLPATPASNAMLALERMCLEHATGILSDSRAALDMVQRDYGQRDHIPSGIAYLGLPESAQALPQRQEETTVEVLIVGRLEQRKGTPLLFEILPRLLERHPNLIIRFVGADNSMSDGWQRRHGIDYPNYFYRRHPNLQTRVRFEGYADEAQLAKHYRTADIVAVPSLYESFGLVYLEAMRAALPVVTFGTGGALEIFSAGTATGAILVQPGDSAQFASAMSLLVTQPRARQQLGLNGAARFAAAFRAETMAEATLSFYNQVKVHNQQRSEQTGHIYQSMEALDFGDSVSAIACQNAILLEEIGQPRSIVTEHVHPQLHVPTIPNRYLLSTPESGLIFHYWGYNTSTWILWALHGRKAIHYHNITPPTFFAPDSAMYQITSRGYAQLRQIIQAFDLIIADSHYNIRELVRYINKPYPAIAIYPTVDAINIKHAPYDQSLFDALSSSGEKNIIFVGRIVRNKRQDQLMRLFDYYCREINPRARLWLIGSGQGDRTFYEELVQLRSSLSMGERICFTGKVSEQEMTAYYRAADLFVCASEHEGFCMPITHAMAHDIPVIAYAAAAVPETMGDAGLLIQDWDIPRIAELMHVVLTDDQLQRKLKAQQQSNLARFSTARATEQITAVVHYLQDKTASPLFEWVAPLSNQQSGSAW